MDGHRTRRGFTLVELMVTVALIVIIGLIAAPGMFRTIPSYRVSNAAKVLATEVNLARMRAIAKNRLHELDFDVTFQDIDLKEEITGSLTLVKSISFADQFQNVTLGFKAGTVGLDGAAIGQAVAFGTTSAPQMQVRPDGLLGGSGVFYLIPSQDLASRSDRMRAIEVSRAGRVTIYKYDSAATPPWREI